LLNVAETVAEDYRVVAQREQIEQVVEKTITARAIERTYCDTSEK